MLRFLFLCVCLLPFCGGVVVVGQVVCGPDGCREAPAVALETYSDREAAVRCRRGGSCGSGSLCGRDSRFDYVLTNAHVVGTTPGASVVVDRGGVSVSGVVLFSAFSDQVLVDVAFVGVPAGSFDVEPVKLSVSLCRAGTRFVSVGYPQCRGPVTFADSILRDGNPLLWQRNSIPGQSGSALVSGGVQIGLLTWSWGGRGAGQDLGRVYSVVRDRKLPSDRRPSGLVEVQSGDRPLTENGVFSVTDVGDLPVWNTEGEIGGGGGGGGGAECPLPDDDGTRRLRDRLRERGVDWLRFIQLVLELVELFSAGTVAADSDAVVVSGARYSMASAVVSGGLPSGGFVAVTSPASCSVDFVGRRGVGFGRGRVGFRLRR